MGKEHDIRWLQREENFRNFVSEPKADVKTLKQSSGVLHIDRKRIKERLKGFVKSWVGEVHTHREGEGGYPDCPACVKILLKHPQEGGDFVA